MSTLTRLVIRPGVIAVVALQLYLVSAAWLKAERLWQWKASLLAQEFGHWFLIIGSLAAVLGWWSFAGWKRIAIVIVSLASAIVLLLPAIGAARLTPGFQWCRLWLPWTYHHPEVVTERKTFWQDACTSLDLIVYRPAAQPPSPAACVIMVHGGGWDSGDANEFADWNEELASHGIVALAINYRLAPAHPWPAQRDDVRQAITWAKAHAKELSIDPAKIILMGRSAGGQIAAACAYGDPEVKVAGCIAFYAPMDMVFARKYAYTDDILDSLKLLRQLLGGDPEQFPDNYRTASAINFVNQTSPPMLLIHGTNDSLVWVKQSQRMTQRLEEAGVAHHYLELPWATHACDYFPSTPDGQLTMNAVLDFIASSK